MNQELPDAEPRERDELLDVIEGQDEGQAEEEAEDG